MPERLISQLAHVEILTPSLEGSLPFYTDLLGLEVSARQGGSVYLRGWGEFFHHSLQLTEATAHGLGHIAWRADGPEQLEKAVARIEATGRGEGWYAGALGHGPAYRYRPPGGHVHEIFWEVDRHLPAPESASTYPNRAQRFVPRGAAVRSLDHVTIASNALLEDVEWLRDTLGHRYMEYVTAEEHPEQVVFAMTTTCERGHDLGIVADFSDVPGRINHVAFWLDQREEHRRAADVLLDAGVEIEFGPGRHGMGEQDYLYVREPSGLRVELNSGGYRNYEPDWKPRGWTPAQGANSFYRNVAMPHSMVESFPEAEVAAKDTAIARTGLFT